MIFLYIIEGHLPETGAGGCSVAQGTCPAEPSKDWYRHQARFKEKRSDVGSWGSDKLLHAQLSLFFERLLQHWNTLVRKSVTCLAIKMLVRTEAWVKLKDLHLPEAWGSDHSLKDLLVLQHTQRLQKWNRFTYHTFIWNALTGRELFRSPYKYIMYEILGVPF